MLLNRPATALWTGDARRRCTIRDISAHGARVVFTETHSVPAELVLALTENGKVTRRCRVIWRSDTDIGVAFEGPGAPALPPASAPPPAVALDC